jgi:hypothetical protein
VKRLGLTATGAAALLALAFLGGRLSKRPEVRTETKAEYKERIQWRERTVTVASTSANVAKHENVRVVTKWLRPDGTVSKETALSSTSAHTGTSQASVVSASQSQGSASRDSKSVTVSAPTYQPRLHVQGLLGLDLRNGARREWGVAASYRIAGPVTVGAWALPGLRVGGAGVGLSF